MVVGVIGCQKRKPKPGNIRETKCRWEKAAAQPADTVKINKADSVRGGKGRMILHVLPGKQI